MKNPEDIIKKVIDKYDPIGLLSIGCPQNEYNVEIKDISTNICQCKNTKEIQKHIHKTFVKWFGKNIAGKSEKYKKPAEDIAKYFLNSKENKIYSYLNFIYILFPITFACRAFTTLVEFFILSGITRNLGL